MLEPAAVLAAVCDPTRYAILRVLAEGEPIPVLKLASRLGRTADNIAKHLRVLRSARLVRLVAVPGQDRRQQFHEMPALFRAQDAAGKRLLDFGVIVLRLDP